MGTRVHGHDLERANGERARVALRVRARRDSISDGRLDREQGKHASSRQAPDPASCSTSSVKVPSIAIRWIDCCIDIATASLF